MKKEQEKNPMQSEFNLATVNGEQILLPHDDLYIPPNALKIFLESFEGPLDLLLYFCLLYTSPSPRDGLLSRMPSSA